MISFKNSGNFDNLEKFLNRFKKFDIDKYLHKYGQAGVRQLSMYTPRRTGVTAGSWGYTIKTNRRGSSISWTNSNTAGGIPIVILLQYGHGTGWGSYVQGIDFINPALQSIFYDFAEELWREVVNS